MWAVALVPVSVPTSLAMTYATPQVQGDPPVAELSGGSYDSMVLKALDKDFPLPKGLNAAALPKESTLAAGTRSHGMDGVIAT